MHIAQRLRQHPPFENKPTDDIYSSVQLDQPQPPSIESLHESFGDIMIASLGFLLLLGGFIILCFSLRPWKNGTSSSISTEEDMAWSEKLNPQVPCPNCHYFKSSYYLPCAVNPKAVLKPEAMDCRDFKPRSES